MLKIYKKIIVNGQNYQQKLAAGVPADKLKPGLLNGLALVAGAASALLLLSVFFAVLVIPGSIAAYLVWRKFRNLQSKPLDESLTAEYRVIKDPQQK